MTTNNKNWREWLLIKPTRCFTQHAFSRFRYLSILISLNWLCASFVSLIMEWNKREKASLFSPGAKVTELEGIETRKNLLQPSTVFGAPDRGGKEANEFRPPSPPTNFPTVFKKLNTYLLWKITTDTHQCRRKKESGTEEARNMPETQFFQGSVSKTVRFFIRCQNVIGSCYHDY